MDHLIDDNDRLKPRHFCGGEATFDHDDNGWNKRVPPACGCREGECESKPTGCRMAAEVARRDPAVM